MKEPYDIALEALGKMRSAIGQEAAFSVDQIWQYATQEVPSARRPGAITKLWKNGQIVRTGKIRNAATEKRAGSKVPEYKFPLAGVKSVAMSANLDTLSALFDGDCKEVMAIGSFKSKRLISSMLAKRLTILTGLAGSGKTKLAQAFSRWITPDPGWIDDADHSKGKKPNPYCVVIPVGADWTGSDNVLGYADGLRERTYTTKPRSDSFRGKARE